MAPISEVFVRVRPDMTGFRADTERGMGGAQFPKLGAAHGQAYGRSFHDAFKPIAAAVGTMLGALAVGKFLKDAVTEGREAVRISNLTAAALKSTGGAANLSAQQVGALADRLSALTGVDDEVIQSSENLLLTFTNVRNAAGRNNDVFNQAVPLIEDMSAALNNGVVTMEGLDHATIAVGKALQDPITGMTALRRVGIVFNEEQVRQVTLLQKSGDLMGAQKIILAELRKEFGGAAVAAADPAQRMAVAWANLKETIGIAILPMLARLAGFMTGTVAPAVQGFMAGLRTGRVDTEGFIGVMQRIGAIARDVFGGLRQLWTDLKGAGFNAAEIKGLAIALGALAIALWAATAPVSLIVVGIAALVAGLLLAYKHSAAFRQVVSVVVEGLKLWADYMIFMWTQVWVPFFTEVGRLSMWLWREVLQPAFSGLVALWQTVSSAALTLWQNVLEPFFAVVGRLALWLWQNVLFPAFEGWRIIIERLMPVLEVLWKVAAFAFEVIRSVVQVAWAIISKIFEAWWWYISNVLAPIIMWFVDHVIRPYLALAGEIISTAWNKVIRPVFEALGNFISTFVAPAFSRGVDAIATAWNRVKEAARAPVNFVIETVINKGIIDTWNTIAGWFGVKGVPHIGTIGGGGGGGGGRVMQMATGGIVPGQGNRDTELIVATPGERVLSIDQVAALGGHGAIDALVGRGTGGPFAFQAGGIVGLMSNPAGWIRSRIAAAGSVAGRFGSNAWSGLLAGLVSKATDAMISKVRSTLASLADFGPGGGVSTGGLAPGISAVLAMLRAIFGNVPVISGFRAGSRTLSGSLSYHALGRAIDIAPVHAWAIALNRAYGRQLRELITPWNDLNIWNGQPHVYTGAVWNQHNFAGGNAHIHAAMAGGGVLTEPVMGIGRSGRTYSFAERGPETVVPAGGTLRLHPSDIVELADAIGESLGRQLTGSAVKLRQMARMY